MLKNTERTQISSQKKRVQLKGMTLDELRDYFVEIGENKFRSEQVFKWMYDDLVTEYDDMLNIPKKLRSTLTEKTILITLNTTKIVQSTSTGTKKFIYETNDRNIIESVIIPEEKRTTLCISTQVGCPLDCKFCATGLMGYKKNLTTGEIFDQYMLAAKIYGKDKITNLVYMGMGEPLLNFNATIKTLKIFSEKLTAGISPKRITVSTAGIAPKIIELANTGMKARLAFSLHSCFEDRRDKIMPINEKYPLKQNIEALKYYYKKTNTRITFEYVMLKGVNDRDEDINALVKLCSQMPSKINIIPFNSLQHMNPTGYAAELEPTPKQRIEDFAQKLRNKNISVFVRNTQGNDIAAACGQLAYKQAASP
ncbi:MAG: 23S rRNA (adenine(2503)-C(2))-methyltransferase RlmN [Ignavibacteriaceae bacterium]